MRRKLLPLFLLGLIALMGSCVGDDIDSLQGQLDDLTEKVDELEKSQQEALLAAIANLEASIAALQADVDAGDSELADQYAALLNSLQLLEDEVANNASSVYYGNLLTDADFAAFAAQEATIVTGKVVAVSQAHVDALATVKMVGGNLTIKGGSSVELANLQNVAGALYISDLSTEGASVKLPVLASIGDELMVANNSALTSFMADALILINGNLETMGNPLMTTLSLAALDQVGSINVNEYNPDDTEYIYLGSLTTLDLSSTNVLGDVRIEYVTDGALHLGTLGGNFYLGNTNFTELVINSETIMGDFTLMYNGMLSSIDFSTIKTIKGELNIGFSSTEWYDWLAPVGLQSLPSFDALETIGGNVRIEGNSMLTSIEGFDKVTTFTGTEIRINYNGGSGTGLTLINAFNALEDGGPSAWTKMDVVVYENAAWFDGFNALVEANNVTVNVTGLLDENWANGPTRIDGFAAMTACKSLELNAKNAESFSAFSVLDNFKGWGVTNCLILDMPDDTTVGLCSMSGILTKIKNGDFDSKPAIFRYNWSELDKTTAVDQLLAPCVQ